MSSIHCAKCGFVFRAEEDGAHYKCSNPKCGRVVLKDEADKKYLLFVG